MRKNNQYYLRKIHRYLGLFIGIQLLLWTLGGLYFSWSNMDEIHGDTLLHEKKYIKLYSQLFSPDSAFSKLKSGYNPDRIRSFKLIELFDEPYYHVSFFEKDGKQINLLIGAKTGKIRDEVTKEEAVFIAKKFFHYPADTICVNYMEEKNVGPHHEYREKPLPAWQIEFDHASKSRLYISAVTGELINLRNEKWRIFDFLWMLHTMDYAGRDNITNWLLRLFSIFGLITVLSGFTLFYISSPTIKKLRNKKLK